MEMIKELGISRKTIFVLGQFSFLWSLFEEHEFNNNCTTCGICNFMCTRLDIKKIKKLYKKNKKRNKKIFNKYFIKRK